MQAPSSRSCLSAGSQEYFRACNKLYPRSLYNRRLAKPGCVAGVAVRIPAQLEQGGHDKERLIEKFGYKPNFSWEFQLGGMIGSGSFGVVHVATHLKSGRKYAVKSIPKHFFGSYLDPNFVARVQHEVDVSRHMGQSLNVVHLVEVYEDDVCVDLVMELACGGSLYNRIKRGGITEATAARIIVDILRAVAQCHAKGVAIRDVKPENFLFVTPREESPCKMADFGLAQYCRAGQTLTERVGTPYYVAPEVLRQSYSFPADVWSAGVTAYQLLTGRLPWHADPEWVEAQLEAGRGAGGGDAPVSNKVLWRAIMYGELDFTWAPWDSIADGACDLVQSMLVRDPEQRPSAAELLHHPWLAATTSSLDAWDEQLASSSSSSGRSSRSSRSSSGHSSSSSSSRAACVQPLADSLVQRLQRYGTYGRLKQIGLRQVVKCMMASDRSALQGLDEVFDCLDSSLSGRIPLEAVRGLLVGGNYELSEVEVRLLLSQLDANGDGWVSYDEWLAATLDWTQAQTSSTWRDWLRQVFDSFDLDGDGSISSAELLALVDSTGMFSSELDEEPYMLADTVPAMMRQVDTNGNGQMSFEEFAALLQTDVADQLALFCSRRRRPPKRQLPLHKLPAAVEEPKLVWSSTGV